MKKPIRLTALRSARIRTSNTLGVKFIKTSAWRSIHRVSLTAERGLQPKIKSSLNTYGPIQKLHSGRARARTSFVLSSQLLRVNMKKNTRVPSPRISLPVILLEYVAYFVDSHLVLNCERACQCHHCITTSDVVDAHYLGHHLDAVGNDLADRRTCALVILINSE